jgi:hypothetical protein
MRHDAAVYVRDRRRLAPVGLALGVFGFVISPLVHAIVVHGNLGRHSASTEDEYFSELAAHEDSASHDEDTGHHEFAPHDESTSHDEFTADDPTAHDRSTAYDESRSHRHGRHGHTHRDGNLEHLGACFVPALSALDLPAPPFVSLQRIIGRERPSIIARIRFPEVPQGP